MVVGALRPTLAIPVLLGLASPVDAGSPVVLTSVAENVHVDRWSASGPVPGRRGWSVAKSALHGGKQEGVDLIAVDNGRLTFTIVPTRGMSLHRAQMGDVRLGWDSPVKEIVNPVHIHLEANGGLGWLDGFNEWLPRGGIEWSGHPGLDGQRMLTLHGRLQSLPASEVSVVVEEGGGGAPGRIRVLGTVEERSMFGANFEMRTEISTEMGSDHIVVSDRVTNRSAEPREFQMLYHSDYGEPILDEGARFVAAASEVRPLDGNAARHLAEYPDYAGPHPGFVENVFGIVLHGDARNRTTVMLHNRARDKAVTLSYALDELPFLTLWKNTGAAGEAYVTGLEPGTSYPANRSIERKGGRVPVLGPGESRTFTIDFVILDSTAAVSDAIAAIETLRRGRPTTLNPQTIKP
jgi:hypothetical protein